MARVDVAGITHTIHAGNSKPPPNWILSRFARSPLAPPGKEAGSVRAKLGRRFVTPTQWFLELAAENVVSPRNINTLTVHPPESPTPLPVAAHFAKNTTRTWSYPANVRPFPVVVACRIQRYADANAPCPLCAVAIMAKCQVMDLFLRARRDASRAEHWVPHFARKRFPDFDWDSVDENDEAEALRHHLLPKILATYQWGILACITEGYSVLRGARTWRNEDAPARKMRVELDRCYRVSREQFDSLMFEVFDRQLYLEMPKPRRKPRRARASNVQ